MLQTKLPLELREMVYENLVDPSSPRVVPRSEESKPDVQSSTARPIDSWNGGLFEVEHACHPEVMGLQTSDEIREYLVRKTPLYIRGTRTQYDQLQRLLQTSVSSGRLVRDFTRHLRVYLRCEDFEAGLKDYLAGARPLYEATKDRRRLGERRMYDIYRRRLESLHRLPFDRHKIKIEICIFHDFFEPTILDGVAGSVQARKHTTSWTRELMSQSDLRTSMLQWGQI
jgi:hypothetical protein